MNRIDMSVLDFVTVYGAIIESIITNKIPDDYRISILCSSSYSDIDIYPPDDKPFHKLNSEVQ